MLGSLTIIFKILGAVEYYVIGPPSPNFIEFKKSLRSKNISFQEQSLVAKFISLLDFHMITISYDMFNYVKGPAL